jgi:hypothetical protein
MINSTSLNEVHYVLHSPCEIEGGLQSHQISPTPTTGNGSNILVYVSDPEYDVWSHTLPGINSHKCVFCHDDSRSNRTSVGSKVVVREPMALGLAFHQEYCWARVSSDSSRAIQAD